MWTFDESSLLQELRTLPVLHRVAFASSCCERLLPNYRAFVSLENWGDPDLLRQALDEVWNFLRGSTIDADRAQALMHACEAVAPDTDMFQSFLTSAAQNAAAAVTYTLECCLDGDAERATLVGSLADETIYMYLNVVNDPDTQPHIADPAFDAWLLQAPLRIAELEKQRQDIALLKANAILNSDLLEDLRRSSSISGIQPFARGLVKDY